MSSSISFSCIFCMNTHLEKDGIILGNCGCKYFGACIKKYIEDQTRKRLLPLKCPKCRKPLNSQKCLKVLSGTPEKEILETTSVQHEHIETLRYCANPRCGTPFDFEKTTCEDYRVKCPLCKKSACMRCKIKWHKGRSCEEVQMENPVLMLSDKMEWKQCPSCSQLIERTGGCPRMTCSCGVLFCYVCGKPYETKIGSCQFAPCTCMEGGDAFDYIFGD